MQILLRKHITNILIIIQNYKTDFFQSIGAILMNRHLIKSVQARQIISGRGIPAVEAEVTTLVELQHARYVLQDTL